MDDLINQFTSDIAFDALEGWCAILAIDYEEPPTDDMYTDWEVEIRDKIAESLIKLNSTVRLKLMFPRT